MKILKVVSLPSVLKKNNAFMIILSMLTMKELDALKTIILTITTYIINKISIREITIAIVTQINSRTQIPITTMRILIEKNNSPHPIKR